MIVVYKLKLSALLNMHLFDY